MIRPPVLKEEILHYMNEEWQDSLQVYDDGLWLTTRALQLKLRGKRGLLISWPTLSIRLHDLLRREEVDMIKTSAGECWKPSEDTLKI